MNKLLVLIYIIVAIALFLYSFTQVDLSLPLSQIPILGNFKDTFQYIGYFNRPLSTGIFTLILLSLFILYVLFIRRAIDKKITKKTIWILLIVTSVILTFSYNAFSYDLFNYIFDAKIFTFYNENPYLHKALDYPGDPMLSFMRWTHRVYPYGPIWLALTVPLSFIGANIFTLTFILFKLLMAASFIGTLFIISKIFQLFSPDDEEYGLIFFGLNPLILIESLVSSHVDIVMMFFALLSIYLLMKKNLVMSWGMLLISIGIKFATVFLLPVFILKTFFSSKKYSWNKIFYLSTLTMSLAIIAASIQSGNFQPWYLFYFLTFATFISKRPIIFISSIVGSFFGLLNYLPTIYLGVWDATVPQHVSNINITALSIIIVSSVGYLLVRPKKVS